MAAVSSDKVERLDARDARASSAVYVVVLLDMVKLLIASTQSHELEISHNFFFSVCGLCGHKILVGNEPLKL